ncbi:magnesium transporter [Legionella oakridgensis]|uniref:Magnesium transporter MgtE n=2 Tax=Legionella oakridgensis TaxID=29423 RepID=W0BH37_9GAMM|nr:magnesium transporter [Legionella oakridgensis]AHE67942.1 Mg2+ transporter MgtE [Legionella oakridgensis ATCC 33761 = DSM 21215]ETO92574.1 Mg2+ transporter [Legionella oakridgensis RV-2-2007]KTD38759.1 Magnesium transporter MgtE [Legionella oakridgensis]STY20944.1 Magnesium transporter mgtE [Legionella longbeachae]
MRISKKNLPTKELIRFLSEASVPIIVKEINHEARERRGEIFNLLPANKADKVFSYLEPVHQAQIIRDIDNKKALALLEKMEPDDRARLFDELPEETSARFLRRLSVKERRATSLLLKYPNETAGRIMSPFFISLHTDMTVEESLRHVRTKGKDAETIYILPVVDQDMHLQGVVELDKLVMADPTQRVAQLMYKEIKSFSVYDDQEKVARFIQSTDWLAVPIVEDNQRLVGIVTIDDAMSIMQLEETEDIIRGSASGPLGKPYLSVPIFRLMKIRIIWLSMLAIAGTLTVNVLHTFETTLNQVIVLALFIPLLIGIGGNTGSQSATTIVRALAVEDVRVSDFLTVALRETAVGILIGLSLGLAGYFIVWLIFRQKIALIISFSLLAICTMAALTGSLMPILARVLRLDPAVVSAPFVSTIIDATGLLIYFMIAKIILNF